MAQYEAPAKASAPAASLTVEAMGWASVGAGGKGGPGICSVAAGRGSRERLPGRLEAVGDTSGVTR